jgi:RNA polymerase sigma-70 factor, ECF subfamily
MRDQAIVAVSALAATAGLALLYRQPWVLFGLLLALNLILLAFWHRPVDLIRWTVGATIGNLTELLCDLAGVWIHGTRQWLDAAPFYIFLCYPILMLAVPRLLSGFRADRTIGNGWAALLLAVHVGLSLSQGGNNTGQLIVSFTALLLAVWLFHEPRDLAAGFLGMALGLLWELPCTYFGSWRFPHPQLLGLVPYWLPLAYAVFFLLLNRIGMRLEEDYSQAPWFVKLSESISSCLPMDSAEPSQITVLLRSWSEGDKSALDSLAPIVYRELRKLAGAKLRDERAAHTLQPTALIHEAYLKLVDHRQSKWNSRAHFFSVASHLMREILVDNARKFRASKRGGEKLPLEDAASVASERGRDLIALDDALNELAKTDERKSQLISMKYFGGLSCEEIAEALGISVRTVTRESRLAEYWLNKYLSDPA